MITAALVTFAVLAVGWLLAPGERATADRVTTPDPATEEALALTEAA